MTPSAGLTDVPAGKLAEVVTSLEMLARPTPRPDPTPAPWRLHHHERIALAAFRDLFRRIGADWLWASRLALGDAALAAIVHHPDVEVRSLRLGDVEEGLLELDFREPATCELSFFGVAPALVGSGAGRWLMNRALDIAWSRPIRRFWVHTCTHDHPAALPFYLRSGFRAFRRQVEISDDPRLTGLLPRTAAPQVPLIAAE
jgi:GNAT superfamily N-acetyltransferase